MTITQAFGMPPFMPAWISALHGRPRWQVYSMKDAGRPVGGAYVSLNEVPSITLRSSTAITQRDGTFRIDVPNGTYRVLASIPVVVPRGGSVITTGRASGTNNPGVEVKVEGRPVSDVKVIARRP